MLHRFTVELVELLVYKCKVTEEVIQRSVDCKAVDLRKIFLPF